MIPSKPFGKIVAVMGGVLALELAYGAYAVLGAGSFLPAEAAILLLAYAPIGIALTLPAGAFAAGIWSARRVPMRGSSLRRSLQAGLLWGGTALLLLGYASPAVQRLVRGVSGPPQSLFLHELPFETLTAGAAAGDGSTDLTGVLAEWEIVFRLVWAVLPVALMAVGLVVGSRPSKMRSRTNATLQQWALGIVLGGSVLAGSVVSFDASVNFVAAPRLIGWLPLVLPVLALAALRWWAPRAPHEVS